MTVKEISISDFDYPLPKERIALHPLAVRDACRLIVSDSEGQISHHRFSELPDLLPAGTLLVRNNTRVINARIKFRKPTGAEIEIFCLEPKSPAEYNAMFQSKGSCRWTCLIGNRKRWKEPVISREVLIDGHPEPVLLQASVTSAVDAYPFEVEFRWDGDVDFATLIEAAGNIPIPPYLSRDSEESDKTDYQTVYSRIEGSVAAPTAGLHFTPEVFSRLADKGIETADVTLHVGAGTFKPVSAELIGDHPMHEEYFSVSRQTLESLIRAIEEKRPIAAVGTTSVRTLESLYRLGINLSSGKAPYVSQWESYQADGLNNISVADALRCIIAFMDSQSLSEITASTSIMIAPGFEWHIADILVTNFHQPHSTLLLLVSSFLERGGNESGEEPQWRRIYREALDEGYRFLSYGDACLLYPRHIPPAKQ